MEQYGQQGEQAERVAEECDLERRQRGRCQPDGHCHQPEERRARQHQGRREPEAMLGVRGGAHHVAPMIRGSGSRDTPKRSRTEAAMRRARSSSCAPVA